MMLNRIISNQSSLLLRFLKNPSTVKSYKNQQWSLLYRVAKNASLLAHVGWVVQQNDLQNYLPKKIKDNITSAQTIVEYKKRTALWELNRLWRALLGINAEIIVLKGGAYLLSHLPFSQSRMFTDIDILVKKDALKNIEQILLEQDWHSENQDEYDQHYYRDWMHEIPPLKHITRTIEVDIHHTILPLTSRLHPNPSLFFENAVYSGQFGFKSLAPCDMTSHSATHLFYDSDLANKLKDLVDLDQLLLHFSSTDPDFFCKLIKRAQQLQLQRPLFYALRYTHKLLGTTIPAEILQDKTGAPSLIIRIIMDSLVPLAILPEHPDHPTIKVAIARWLLYVRSHYIRMPLKLLLPHLVHKSKIRREQRKNTA
jgi:hypothetical protein